MYLGLTVKDTGVGYAVTDKDYNVLSLSKENDSSKKTVFLGMNTYPVAKPCMKRRAERVNRRNTTRKRFRKNYLRKILEPDITTIDPYFYKRLDQSFFWNEDKDVEIRGKNILFEGNGLTDKEVNKRYPTIHHLIKELIYDEAPHDPRLVFLALNYLISHRGHNRLKIDISNANHAADLDRVWEQFVSSCKENLMLELSDSIGESIGEILLSKIPSSEKKTKLMDVFADYDTCKEAHNQFTSIAALLSGGTANIAHLFNDDKYTGLKLNFKTTNFDDPAETHELELGSDFEFIEDAKSLYDWSILKNILKDYPTIAEAKIAIYNQHKKDLKFLKSFIKSIDDDKYRLTKEIFTLSEKGLCNYTALSKYTSNKNTVVYACSREDFTKYLKNRLAALKFDESSKEAETINTIIDGLNNNEFLMTANSAPNAVIPYQVVYHQFDTILNVASAYMPSLTKVDETGLSGADQLRQIFTFFIPYYIGPLASEKNFNQNAWFVRKSEEAIRPWNLNDVVDITATETNFIEKMIGSCSYLYGEKVLPKESLLYQRFMVLNALAPVRFNGNQIPVDKYHKLFNDLFINKKVSVNKKSLAKWYINEFDCDNKANIEVTGIANEGLPVLKSYHAFKPYIDGGKLSEDDVENIIYTFTIISGDNQRKTEWLKDNYPDLSLSEIAEISSFKFKEWGKLSRAFLTEVSTNNETNSNIIQEMYNAGATLSEILGRKYNTLNAVESINYKYTRENPVFTSLNRQLDNAYIPADKKREITRAIRIADEIKSIFKQVPEKVFIAYNGDVKNPNARCADRKRQAMKINKGNEKMISLIKSTPTSRFNNLKIYLYFMQEGRCAYTHDEIDFEVLSNQDTKSAYYSIEHIYPESKTSDNSDDNLVLIVRGADTEKGNGYPLPADIQKKMKNVWDKWKNKGNISEEKYARLVRNTPLNNEDLAAIASKAFNNPSRTAKTIGKILSMRWHGETEIVYIDSLKINEFRAETNLPTYREISDDYMALNAYISIVMGNIYHTMFVKSPIFFMDVDKKQLKSLPSFYSVKLSTILEHLQERNGDVAWDPEKHLKTVINTIKNTRVARTYYSFYNHSGRNGGFYDATKQKKGNPKNIPIKSISDTRYDPVKYGGYSNLTTGGFVIIEADGKKDGERLKYITAVDLIAIEKYGDTKEGIEQICEKAGFKNTNLIYDKILKVNSTILYDNVRLRITGKTGDYLSARTCVAPLFSDEIKETAKKIGRVYEKIIFAKANKETYTIIPRDDIDEGQMRKIFDELAFIMTDSRSRFSVLYKNLTSAWFEKMKESWSEYTIEDHVYIIALLLKELNPDCKETVSMRDYDGPFFLIRLSRCINGHDIHIIDSSNTGYHKKVTAINKKVN